VKVIMEPSVAVVLDGFAFEYTKNDSLVLVKLAFFNSLLHTRLVKF